MELFLKKSKGHKNVSSRLGAWLEAKSGQVFIRRVIFGQYETYANGNGLQYLVGAAIAEEAFAWNALGFLHIEFEFVFGLELKLTCESGVDDRIGIVGTPKVNVDRNWACAPESVINAEQRDFADAAR